MPQPYSAQRVSDLDRQRAAATIQEAYSQGRLDEVELDERLSMALNARTRRDLQHCVAGLPPAPLAAFRPAAVAETGSVAGGLAHLSALVSWIFGPLLVHLTAAPGSTARKESAKAFNFQLTFGIVFLASAILGGMLLPDGLTGTLVMVEWILWVVFTIVGGARAISGQPWRNPLMTVLPWRALDENGR